tara:strand:+ start:384 stop:560 length:177 start_codon:yes stop_codon:yes gene_type:complete
MRITKVQYTLDIDGNNSEILMATINDTKVYVPFDPANSDYAEIMRQVDAGELTIEKAE